MADTINELKAAVKCGSFSNLYYFYGKDIASVEAANKLIINKAIKKGDEVYNLHSFDGKNFDINEFSDACEALPMFAEYVCCTVCDLNAEELKADDLNWLIKFISDLPETTILIFYYTSFDVTDGKKYPTAKNKKIIDTIAKKGKVCNFELKTVDTLVKEIVAKATKSGSSISKEAATQLVQLCACDSLIVYNELDKLLAYCGNNEITLKAVNDLCPRQIETKTYDLANAIVRKDRYKAMSLLNDLILEKIEPIAILYAVSSNMLDLYRAKVATANRKTASDIVEDFNYKKNVAFRVNYALRDVRYFSVNDLRKCMKILTETDIAMKSSKTDKSVLLEKAILKMLLLR